MKMKRALSVLLSVMMVFSVATGAKPATSRPPTTMPMNRDV